MPEKTRQFCVPKKTPQDHNSFHPRGLSLCPAHCPRQLGATQYCKFASSSVRMCLDCAHRLHHAHRKWATAVRRDDDVPAVACLCVYSSCIVSRYNFQSRLLTTLTTSPSLSRYASSPSSDVRQDDAVASVSSFSPADCFRSSPCRF